MNNSAFGSFVVVSDFHAVKWPLQKVKEHYIKEYDKVYILGDVTDRGENGRGKDGVRLLQEIKELSEQYPEKVVYVPGNHDSFVYLYGTTGDLSAKNCLTRNHGEDTIEDIENMRRNNPEALKDLLTWLGNQPLQVMHQYNGKTYALAHAFFNDLIYSLNPDFNLKTLTAIKNQTARNLGEQIIWFRKSDNSYNPEHVPADVIEVVGHTPESTREGYNLDLNNSRGGRTKVICVDGGIVFEDNMLKYDGGQSEVRTVNGYHQDTSSKMIEDTTLFDIIDATSFEDYSTVLEAMKESAIKHGVEQARIVLTEIANANDDWYIYVSRDNRDAMRAMGDDQIRLMLNSVERPYDETSDTVNRFLATLYDNDAEFKVIVDYQAAEENKSAREMLNPPRQKEDTKVYGKTTSHSMPIYS